MAHKKGRPAISAGHLIQVRIDGSTWDRLVEYAAAADFPPLTHAAAIRQLLARALAAERDQ